MAKTFQFHYFISNNGDGSASLQLQPSAEAAEKADSEQSEGWGEPCNGTETLKVDGNKLFYQDNQYNESKKKYETVWVEIKQ